MIKQPIKEYKDQIKPNESEFRYLEKSTNWLATIARNRINSYANNIPESDRKSLRTRFKNDFGATYFELLIHQVFYSENSLITEHPNVPGSYRKPDYLIEFQNEKVYIECKEFKNLSDEEKKLEKVKKRILTQLSTLKSEYYLYNIKEITIIDENVGNLNSSYDEITKKLKTAPPKDIEDEYDFKGPNFELINEKIRLRLSFSLKHDWKEKNTQNELLGTHTGNVIYDFSEKSLRKGLINKMKRYGRTSLPLIVSLNVASHWYCKRLIFEWMFYGHTWENPQTGKEGRDLDGIFTESNNNLDHVAGALIFFTVNPYSEEKTEYYFFKNPNFHKQISIMQNLTTIEFKGDNIIYTPNKSLEELTDK